MDYVSILKQYFGFSSFRGIQEQIVASIGSGKDTLGLMPTGGGKSIAFQVPALAMDGVCIVVTPLIALMKDQVKHLHERGVLAASIHSGMSHAEVLKVLDNAVYGGVKFLYVSPERLSTSLFLAKVRYMKICFITVDEAHCISQWGYDFRPSYLKIADLRDLLPGIPVLALTATATQAVVEDIMLRLRFVDGQVFRMSFRRENLVYVVRPTDNKEDELLHILNSVQGCAIVYSRSRKGTKDIARMLSSNGISATFYHAGLDFAVKDQRQMDWQNDNVRVMVATNAFGMGIDKPDVRLVVHMDCPDSIEAYFQEAGRGGRDGNRSYAVLLYSKGDKKRLLSNLSENFPEKDYIRKVYDDLCYFFQLALHDGEGAKFEFNIDRFCCNFRHFPTKVNGALSVLQRAGYLLYDADPDSHARCRFLISRDELYNIVGLSPLDDDVLSSLLRVYGGLFSDFVYIEEARIAQASGHSSDDVKAALKSLTHRCILKYVPRRTVPIIYYTRQRIESSRLVFDKDIYEVLLERMTQRINAMIEYADSQDECRSTLLLRYFGEDANGECGRCDVCQEKRILQKQTYIEHAVETLIQHFSCNSGVIPIASISKLNIPRADLDAAIEFLMSDGRLKINNQCLYLI